MRDPAHDDGVTPVAIVTGGGSGIGRATAVLLAERGYNLVLVGRRRHLLDDTRSAILDAHHTAVQPVAIDLCDRSAAATITAAAIDVGGRIDLLVNSAGTAILAGIADITDEIMQRMFELNTFAPARLINACWPHFLSQGSGCVVNVSSMAVFDPFPGLAVYAASKCALDGLTKAIISEGREHGITAYSVAPGAVETQMLRSLFDESQLPRSQTLDSADVAQLIVACAAGDRPEDIGTTIPIVAEQD